MNILYCNKMRIVINELKTALLDYFISHYLNIASVIRRELVVE